MKTGFISLLLSTLLFLFLGCSKKSDSNNLAYSFFVAGHTYGNPTYYQYGLHPPLMNHVAEINQFPKLELGVFTGDVVPKATAEYWEAAQADMAKFNVPIHIAAGNHDRGADFERIFEKYFYAFEKHGDLFIILSPTDWNIEGEQLEFLKSTLAANSSRNNNIFIFCHELIWWAPDNDFGKIEINYRPHYPGKTNYWTELHPMLDSLHNEVFLFAGDIGATEIVTPFMYYKPGNASFLANGMGGGKKDNIIAVEVKKNGQVGFKLWGLNQNDLYELDDLEKYTLPK